MSTSFFDLPREIRDTIYEMVFETPLRDGKIAPDLEYTRRRTQKDLADSTINNGLALLLSCKQASEEACTSLYGRNTFYFDDTDHCCRYVTIKDFGHCKHCKNFGRDADASNNKHDIDEVPFCDMAYMHDWLVTIGEKNRMRIRQIQLHFSSSIFTKTLDEWDCEGRPKLKCDFGGDILLRGLELLSRAHNLQTIRITFKKPRTIFNEYDIELAEDDRIESMNAFVELFAPEYSGHVKAALSGITGIKRLECEEMRGTLTIVDEHGREDKPMNAARAGLRETRKVMEFGHVSRLQPQESLLYGQDPTRTNWSKRWKVWSPWPVVSARWM